MATEAPHTSAPSLSRSPDPVAQGLVRLMFSMLWLYTQESRKNGLTAQQMQLLCTAARREVGMSEMAELMRCDPSNVSRLLDRLQPRGLVYRGRAERDGRVSVIKLTDQGQSLVQSIEADLEARLTGLVADWPSYKRESIADALARLIETIQEDLAAEAEAAEETDPPAAKAGAR